jgi:hypothetical protein
MLALFLSLIIADAKAQDGALQAPEDPVRQIHWAMGAFFGTGWYQVDENRTMFIFRIPPRMTLRESAFDDDGKRKLGVELQFPLSFGLHQLDDLPDFLDFDNFATVSFTPGIQVEIPITKKWVLKPHLNAGWGTETNSSDSAWIYYGGIKSRYQLGNGKLDLSLLNGVYFAGYKPEYENRGEFGSLMAGLEFRQPQKKFKLGGDAVALNWHLTYNSFFDRLNLHVDDEHVASVKDQWEIGLSLGKRNKPIKILFFNFDQIGLSYKRSSNGRYRAISVNLRSPFDH